MNKMRD